ncbi:MAG: hypothetical protein M3P28_04510 [Thermoproteota archaeon]|nr:hypothetical protein [Thermoproteota archaeon]
MLDENSQAFFNFINSFSEVILGDDEETNLHPSDPAKALGRDCDEED